MRDLVGRALPASPIAGTAAEAADRVRRLAAAGADRLDCANDSEPGHRLDRLGKDLQR